MDRLRELEFYDETWIIVTSDHGELLGEDGRWGHGRSLYQREVRIPMIVKPPRQGARGQRNHEPVQLVDVLPMILAELDLPRPSGVQGGVPPNVGHPLCAEVYPVPAHSQEGDWRMLVRGRHKLLWGSKGQHLLFDLGNDPREQRNLYDDKRDLAQDMISELETFFANLPAPRTSSPLAEVDDDTRRVLEALGYLE